MSSGSTIASHESRISQIERWEIADQLGRVLMSSWFRSSSRSSQLLRHVVEVAIQGQTERLRERQIAIEAFHRKPTYDNNSDPVVRVAAGEVRKRLAQYYGDPKNSGELRIELPVGSYVPVFHFQATVDQLREPELATTELEDTVSPPEESPATVNDSPEPALPLSRSRGSEWWLLGSLMTALLIAFISWRAVTSAGQRSGFDSFWDPVVLSEAPPLISVGELRARELSSVPDVYRSRISGLSPIELSQQSATGVPVQRIAYINSVARIASVLGSRHKAFDVRGQSATTFADISSRPIILLGSYDNDWAYGMLSTIDARFQLKIDPAKKLSWITDTTDPGKLIAPTNISAPGPSSYEAFSIVIRETGKLSQQTRLFLAGVTDEGTIAAAEFVSNPKYLNEFAAKAPKDWQKKNIEFLLDTRVIENVRGIPQVVGCTVW